MTSPRDFAEIIDSRARLREIRKAPSRFVAAKVIDHVDGMCRWLIAAAPFVILASTDAAGAVDVSPKGDPPGFVRVLDAHRLAIPDRPGNNRADTMESLLQDHRIGLIFLVPGRRETLRVSGRGGIVRDDALNKSLAHDGRAPDLAIVVGVARVFFPCAKCMMRSHLWEPARWPDTAHLTGLAETMKHHGRLADPLDEIDRIVRTDAEDRLY